MSSRRDFIVALLGGAMGTAAATAWANEPEGETVQHNHPAGWHGNETIAMVLYPGFTTLDVFGPHHMFILMSGAKVDLVAATMDPVVSETGIKITPTRTFEECPEKLTVLFVPGGSQGTLAAAEDEQLLTFLADRGAKAEWVTSVCTGSVILAAAGLLDGYKATSHWLARPVLNDFGAIAVDERIVIDRNRITGAGVTAGLDFSLDFVGKMRGDGYAKAVQLFAEYDPQPPYDAGSPEKADPGTVAMLRAMHQEFGKRARQIAQKRTAK